MAVAQYLFVLALAALLFDRSRVLLMIYDNAPQRLVKVNTLANHQVLFQDEIRSCEDVLILEKNALAIVACDSGRERWNTVMGFFHPGPIANAELYAYSYADPSAPAALEKITLAGFDGGRQDFHSLGLAYDEATSILYICNHAKSGAKIEMFKLEVRSLTATHIRTIEHPLLHGPNSISLINSHEFLVTNDHYFTAEQSRLLSQMETYIAPPTGTVVYVNVHGAEVQARVVANMAFANGIEILNDTAVAVASTSKGSVYLYSRPDPTALEYHSQIPLPFMPDNLSLSNGTLLIAGHAHLPSLLKYAKTRYICGDAAELAQATPKMKEKCGQLVATSWVSTWSETKGLEHLYVDTEFPTSTTAAKDSKRGVGIITGLYAKGIMVWKER